MSSHQIITIGMQQADMAELREISTQPADNHAIYAQYQDIASRDIISFVQNNIVARKLNYTGSQKKVYTFKIWIIQKV